jgi:hypothetical protein
MGALFTQKRREEESDRSIRSFPFVFFFFVSFRFFSFLSSHLTLQFIHPLSPLLQNFLRVYADENMVGKETNKHLPSSSFHTAISNSLSLSFFLSFSHTHTERY